jgi:hypothetical protein
MNCTICGSTVGTAGCTTPWKHGPTTIAPGAGVVSNDVLRVVALEDEVRRLTAVAQGIVEEMKADATRPRGGQSVSPRRMPVPLSICLELERALGPEQGAYTYEAYLDLLAQRDAALQSEGAAREALKEAIELSRLPRPVTEEEAILLEMRQCAWTIKANRALAEPSRGGGR